MFEGHSAVNNGFETECRFGHRDQRGAWGLQLSHSLKATMLQ